MAGARRRGYRRNLVSVLAALLAGPALAQPVITETTGPLAYYGASTLKVKAANNIIVDATSSSLQSCPTMVFDQRGCCTYTNQGFLGDCGSATPDSPGTPEVPFIFLVPLDSTSYTCDDAGVTVTNEIANEPVSYMDIKTSPTTIKYRFTPNGMTNDGSTYGQNANVAGEVTASSFDVSSTGHVETILTVDGRLDIGDVGDLPIALGIRSEYGLFANDLHAYAGLYGSAGSVFGYGRQDHTQDGSVWIETAGTCNTPTCMASPSPGYSEARIYTDRLGMMIQLGHPSAQVGAIGNWLRSDKTIATSQSLTTSVTVSANNLATSCSGIKTSAYTVTLSDSTVVCSGTFTVSLPPAATCVAPADTNKTLIFPIVNYGSGTITVDPDASETIMGTSTRAITAGASIVVQALPGLGGFVIW